ncbi:MAG: phospho-N-acetylmuramoyl-pentapeptide-transferase [Firmicutes bacterium]|nr:phospho-N-acetylmuramoyl-pentapeptide-transferase [Bacillota bacterium]
MIILTKAVLVMMISLLLSIVTGIVLIPILKRLKAGQRLSEYLEERHKSKQGTPTMGGLIFIIPVIVVMLFMCLFGKIKFNTTIFIVIFTFLSYSLIGFIDDFLIIKRNNNKGLTESSKFILQVVIAIIFFYLFMKSGNEPLLWIHTLGIKLDIGFLYGLIILLVLVSSSNAVNITDGLDGLAGSLSLIAFFTFGIISYNTGWLEGYEEVSLFCFSISGSLIGFLLFNLNPAKVFMGDTGSLALGAAMGAIAILTRHEILLILIGIVFVIETLTCIIQRVYYKFTKKRLFLMTPIHHSFEKKGYSEIDIVKLFCLVGILSSMVAIIFGVVL